jgi:hypothetical protein
MKSVKELEFIIDSKDKTIDKLWDCTNRVRMLHSPSRPIDEEVNPCRKCGEQYPCSTINALKGDLFRAPVE